MALALTGVDPEARAVELSHVEVQADDGEHEDGEEEQESDLQQRNHGLHDGLQNHLQTWSRERRTRERRRKTGPSVTIHLHQRLNDDEELDQTQRQ